MKPIKVPMLALLLALGASMQTRAQFIQADIGAPATAGSTTASSAAALAAGTGTITNQGGGADIWGTADQFHYYYTNIVGNFDVKVRVTALTNAPTTANNGYADAWIKSELMARLPDPTQIGTRTPNAGDPFFAMMTTRSNLTASSNIAAGQNEVNMQYRQQRNGGCNWPGTPMTQLQPWNKITPSYPNQWMRVLRIGSMLYGYCGTDGANWKLIYTADTANDPAWNQPEGVGLVNPWDTNTLVGLAITAHNNTSGRLGLSVSDNLAFTSGLVAKADGDRLGFTMQVGVAGMDSIATITQVKLDGVDITSQIISSNSTTAPIQTTIVWPGNGSSQVAGATRKIDLTVQTAAGQTVSLTQYPYTVPYFFTVPTTGPVQLSSMDTSKVGFTVRSWQSHAYEANVPRFAEEQIIGLRGANIADQSQADANGNFAWTGALLFANGTGAAGPFPYDTNGMPAYADFGTAFGLGSPNDNSTIEFFTWLYFPTNGVYQIYVQSDDTFYISQGAYQNASDRMGNLVMTYPIWQIPSTYTAYNIPWQVDQAGCYPFRILLENGSGGAGIGIYSSYPTAYGTNAYIPLNDDGHISGFASPIQCFRADASSVAGPYVKKANPVRDAQNVVFYQPIVVDLGDGLNGLTVDPASIVLKVDNVVQNNVTITTGAGTTHIVAQPNSNWSVGAHTILLTFADKASTPNNYSYTWPFTVINVAAPSTITQVPLAAKQDPGILDQSQLGFRVKSYQTLAYQANRHGWTEEMIEGLRGQNVADQFMASSGYYTWSDMLDFASNSGATCEWNFNNAFTTFGINNSGITFHNNVYPFWDNCALEFGTWLVFPQAGTYMMHINSDDGWQVSVPMGTPFNKLGTVIGLRDAGSSTGGPNNGAMVGASAQYFCFNIPAAGAYPFRLLWENGTGGLCVEWSIYQYLPDGSVAKVPVNDPNQPYSIKAYQTTTSADALTPYATFVHPAPDSENVTFYAPIILDLTDGATLAVDPTSVVLRTDNVPQLVTPTKNGTKTHVVQTMASPWQWGFHTNVLAFKDTANNWYTNTWRFSVLGGNGSALNPQAVINIPLTNRVSASSVNLNRPGFLIRSYQTAATPANSSVWVEQATMGLQGANLCDLTLATNEYNSFYWDGPLDFGGNGQNGEFGYNAYNDGFFLYGNTAAGGAVLTNLLGFTSQGGAPNVNNAIMDIATWLVFPQAGNYIMHVNVDDEFRLTSPYGNPFNKVGTELMWKESTGGQSGASGAQVGGTYVTINIPAPGAYPFRLLYWNISGGFGAEWSIYQRRSDGCIEKILINDTNNPNAILAYQVSSESSPYLKNIWPAPASAVGGAPVMTFVPAVTNGIVSQGDLTIDLQDGATAVVPGSVSLSLNGVSMQADVTQPTAGVTHIAHYGTNLFPSGAYGPLTLSYQDSSGRTFNQTWIVAMNFWGTLTNGLALGSGDSNKAGYKMRIYQVDAVGATTGSTVVPTRVHVAEQVLAGIWGPNVAGTSPTNIVDPQDSRYYDRPGTGPSAGVINFNIPGQTGQVGDYTTNNGAAYSDMLLPGIPGTVTATANNDKYNDYAVEYLMYVEFPTNGVYNLIVNSDDGFRLTKGWNAPANNGALLVNSAPAGITTGARPAVQNTYLTSCPITNAVTGNLVLANGIGYGSTTNGEGCFISNPQALAGNIALMYRSAFCSYAQQVENAAAAGAIGVVLVQNRPANEGPFPVEPGVTPTQPIPAIEIEQADGNAYVAALATNGTVSVTITPADWMYNPPAGQEPLGQADLGKGFSDVLIPVVVQAGVYPLRLVQFQGGGGGNCEFLSYVGGTKVLVNDLTQNGLKAYWDIQHAPTVPPNISIASSGGNIVITYEGTKLLSSPDPTLPLSSWTQVSGAASPYTLPSHSATQLYYRAQW